MEVEVGYFSRNRVSSAVFALLSATACTAFLWLSTYPQTPTTANAADLLISSPCELGTVNEGEHEAAFSIENVGKKNIILSTIERSCDCLDITVTKKKLSPGERAEGKCVWNTKGRRGNSETSFTVYYAFAGQSYLHRLQGKIRGNVTPDIAFAPSEVSFNFDGGVQSHEIIFSPMHGKVKGSIIKDVKCYNSALHAELTGDLSVNITFSPNVSTGRQRHFKVDVTFDSIDGHIISVPVVINP